MSRDIVTDNFTWSALDIGFNKVHLIICLVWHWILDDKELTRVHQVMHIFLSDWITIDLENY